MLSYKPSISYNFCGSVTLNPLQLQSGVTQAEMLIDASRHLKNQRGLEDSKGFQTHLSGAKAEIGFSLLGNQPYKFRVNEFGKPDFIVNGKKVDVKVSLFESIVVSTRHTKDKEMIFVFFKEYGDTVKCIGRISCHELLKHPEWIENPRNKHNPDGSPAWCYVIPPDKLLPVNFPKKDQSNETNNEP